MKRYLITAVALLAAASAFAQNLNPTVEVTNVYSSSAKDILKPVQEMAVPDSVTQFNLKLDYSVFDSPYKGAYEFSPFAETFRADTLARKREQFYLRAGIGYEMHPEFEALWSPVFFKDRLRLDVHARHNGFFGNYRGLDAVSSTVHSREVNTFRWDGSKSWGYDALTDIGARATYPWKSGETFLSASYFNLSGKDYLVTRSANGSRLEAGVKSVGTERIRYHACARWMHLGDYGDPSTPYSLVEDKLDVRSGVAFPLSNAGEIYTNLDFSMDRLRKGLQTTAAILWITPGYRFGIGNWWFDLGVKIDAYVGTFERYRTQYIYPDVHVSYTLLDGDMVLYAAATGGSTLNAYGDMIMRNHHFNLIHPVAPGGTLLDNSLERVNAGIGVRGHVWRRFQYDLKAGYAWVANGLLDGIDSLLPCTGYADYHMAYADLKYAWISDCVKVDGLLSLRKTGLKNSPLFDLAVLTGTLKGSYTWNRRITAGLSLDFSSGRTARVSDTLWYRIPGYADLGIFGEYAVNKMLDVWLKGGNLIHSTQQAVPLYGSGGIYFTAGVTLHF